MSYDLLKIDFDKLTKEQSEVITQLLENGVVVRTGHQEEFINCEIEYRRDNDSEGYSDDVIEATAIDMESEMQENLDNFIDNERIYEVWTDFLNVNDKVQAQVTKALENGVDSGIVDKTAELFKDHLLKFHGEEDVDGVWERFQLVTINTVVEEYVDLALSEGVSQDLIDNAVELFKEHMRKNFDLQSDLSLVWEKFLKEALKKRTIKENRSKFRVVK